MPLTESKINLETHPIGLSEYPTLVKYHKSVNKAYEIELTADLLLHWIRSSRSYWKRYITDFDSDYEVVAIKIPRVTLLRVESIASDRRFCIPSDEPDIFAEWSGIPLMWCDDGFIEVVIGHEIDEDHSEYFCYCVTLN